MPKNSKQRKAIWHSPKNGLRKKKEALDLTQRLHFQEYRLDWLLPLEFGINPRRLGSFSLSRLLLTLMNLVELGKIDFRH